MWLLRLLRIVAILVPFVPAWIGYRLCTLIGVLFFLVNVRAHRNVISNLRHVDPDMRWLQREITALRVCITVVTNYYDLLRLRSVDRETVMERVEIDGLEHVQSALELGRGVIIVSGHIGNFSVMARLPAVLGLRAALIAERVDPPALYQYMARLRSAMGIEVIAPGAASIRTVINLLNNNGILLLAADRDVTNHGHPVTFFNRETTLPVGPVALAMRTRATLIPAHTVRVSRDQSRVTIGQPLDMQNTGKWEDDIRANLESLTRRLEQMILADPGQWAVLQRVWPPTTSYGRSEGIGSADDTVQASSSIPD